MTPAQTIRQIDRNIDGIRLELYRRGCRPRLSASEWQLAWDRNPDLCARNETLFRLRGLAQMERDAEIDLDQGHVVTIAIKHQVPCNTGAA